MFNTYAAQLWVPYDLWKISATLRLWRFKVLPGVTKDVRKQHWQPSEGSRWAGEILGFGRWDLDQGISRHCMALYGSVFFPGCWHVAPSKKEDATVMLNCEWGSDRFRFRCYEMCKAWKLECACNTDTFHSDCFLVSVHPMVYNLGAEAVCCHRLSVQC